MDKLFVVFLIIAPIAIFLGGFHIARQIRPLENAPLISKLFVEKKLSLSIITGFFISVFFTFLYSAKSGFSLTEMVAFLVLFILVSSSYYFGMKLGWGSSSSANTTGEHVVGPTSQAQTDNAFPENVTVQNSLSSVKITINSKKRWVLFTMEAFQWMVIGLCFLPIAGWAVISFLQNYLPESVHFLVWLLVAGLVLYFLYVKFMEALEFVFDKEIIEIDNLSVRTEKHGLRFSSKREYPAENINKITGMFYLGGTNTVLKRSPFVNSSMPAFVIWHNHGLRRYHSFGKAIDLADAQRILEMIYSKFPQYKG
jgi:hypothetical protein